MGLGSLAFRKVMDIINSWIKQEVYQDLHTMGLQNADPTLKQ